MIWNGYMGACTSAQRTGLVGVSPSFQAFWQIKVRDESLDSSLADSRRVKRLIAPLEVRQ